jgi:hypothetical protein
MPKSHSPYPPEFRRQMVALVRTGVDARWITTSGGAAEVAGGNASGTRTEAPPDSLPSIVEPSRRVEAVR